MNKLTGRVESVKNMTVQGRVESDKNINVTIQGSGLPSKSLYELWLDEGNVGTFQDFLDSIGGGNMSYIHTQIKSSTKWIVNHNLDRYPSVSVVDTSGNLVIGEIVYVDKNVIEVLFAVEFSGMAYLN